MLAADRGGLGRAIAGLYPTQADRVERRRGDQGQPGAGRALRLGPRRTAAARSHGKMAGLRHVRGRMSILVVRRHTRVDEESGRTELVVSRRSDGMHRSRPHSSSRWSRTSASAWWCSVASRRWTSRSPARVVLALSVVVVGFFFAAVAAVTAQLASTGRAASGLAGAVLGASFLVRAIGDVNETNLSLVSPIGLGQGTRPYDGDRLWPRSGPGRCGRRSRLGSGGVAGSP